MGKDLKGKELGVGISQRKDGLYTARFTTKRGKRVQKYSKNLQECCDWLKEAKYQDKYRSSTVKSTSIKEELPIDRKLCLTIKEAATYSNIGIYKLKELSRQPNCPFVLHIGRRKLIKRQQFEEFISMAKLLYNN